MNPDVVMSRRTGGADSYLIVLDAKYRIEEGLNDALNSIHTYRDALVRKAATEVIKGVVTAAYLPAPHLPELAEKFMHGIKVLMAKNYIANISEETRKGMTKKAEQGIWPSYAPFGYRNIVGENGKRSSSQTRN